MDTAVIAMEVDGIASERACLIDWIRGYKASRSLVRAQKVHQVLGYRLDRCPLHRTGFGQVLRTASFVPVKGGQATARRDVLIEAFPLSARRVEGRGWREQGRLLCSCCCSVWSCKALSHGVSFNKDTCFR